jgi:hypothetical protein
VGIDIGMGEICSLLGVAWIGLVSPHINVQSRRLERVRSCAALGLTSLTFGTSMTIVSAISSCPAFLMKSMLGFDNFAIPACF